METRAKGSQLASFLQLDSHPSCKYADLEINHMCIDLVPVCEPSLGKRDSKPGEQTGFRFPALLGFFLIMMQS